MTKIIAIANQKGGVGKTTSAINIGIGIARMGYRVLLIDADPQANMTQALGYDAPDELENTLSDVIENIMNDRDTDPSETILEHSEGVHLIPSNVDLFGAEMSLFREMGRETIFRRYIEQISDRYDYILIDCMPSLGILTVNALVCADSVLIPTQAAYLSVKGLEQLLSVIGKVRKQMNPKLAVEGILLTMYNARTNYSRDIRELVKSAYGNDIKVFTQEIPVSVRAAEVSAVGKSIYTYDPKGKVAEAYKTVCEEVIANE